MSDNPPMIIDLDESVFSHFPSYEGTIPAGYWGNWLGVLTRANVWTFSEEILEKYNQTRVERFDYPLDNEHILDWYPLLQSVIQAREKFTMAAIGCGWGRWLSAGAFAAKSLSKDFFLIGVEAEPEHFEWLRIHLNENKIDADNYRLISAAASDHCGECWFYVGKSASWYGQSMVSNNAVESRLNIISKIILKFKNFLQIKRIEKYNNETIQRVPSVDLKEVVANQKFINYMMLDIQGVEEIFLPKYPKILQEHILCINVGTHSHEIEKNLRTFFSNLGWECTFDIPMNSKVEFHIRKSGLNDASATKKIIQFGDGVQVWVNKNLEKSLPDPHQDKTGFNPE